MAKEKKAGKKSTVAGENILKAVTEQLSTSLTSLKGKLGEKKFTKRVKKAAKKLVAGIDKTAPKKVAGKVKKAAPALAKKRAKKAVVKKGK